MNLIEKATIINFHRHRIAEYRSGTVKALGWKGEQSQQKRFEVLASLGDFSHASVLDIGCGYGDLKAYLDQRFSDVAYTGIDLVEEFIAHATTRYGDCPNTRFFHGDFSTATLPPVDFILACGAFGYRSKDPDFHLNMIRSMYNASGKACAFNMLDAATFEATPLLAGHDPDRVYAFCSSLSPHVKLLRGYLKDDFTVFMYKDAAASR